MRIQPTAPISIEGQLPSTTAEKVSSQESSSQSSQAANKENAPPHSPTSRPPVPPFSGDASVPPDATAATESTILTPPDGTLPPQLLVLLNSVRNTLTTSFDAAPPHTIQRLAELIVHPRTHYRSLPSYLRALDRVVSVSSGADIFPLPTANMPDSTESGLLNGTGNLIGGGAASAGGLGSDESLGGALLTPIPWLRGDQQGEVRTESTEKVDGPNGPGSVETVSVSVRGVPSTPSASHAETMREAGGVTQGELLRQEQEAGVVPVAQTTGRQTRSATARGLAEGTGKTEEEEHPHARGPEEVGMEDMGPQERTSGKSGFDVEAALGRSVPSKAGEKEAASEGVAEGESDSNETKADQEDIELADADGKPDASQTKAADDDDADAEATDATAGQATT